MAVISIGMSIPFLKSKVSYPSILDDGNTVAWFDMKESYITKDGSDFVSQWDDRSGNTNHLLQATGTNQPLWSSTGVLFDGVDNIMQATFTLAQPVMIYIVFKQVTWTSPDSLFDGKTVSTMSLYQNLNTPEIRQYAGAISDVNNNLTLNTFAILRALFSGAVSKTIVNETTPVVSDAGTATPGGFTLGGRGAADIRFGHTEVKEVILRKIADTAPNEQIIYDYIKDKYSL